MQHHLLQFLSPLHYLMTPIFNWHVHLYSCSLACTLHLYQCSDYLKTIQHAYWSANGIYFKTSFPIYLWRLILLIWIIRLLVAYLSFLKNEPSYYPYHFPLICQSSYSKYTAIRSKAPSGFCSLLIGQREKIMKL